MKSNFYIMRAYSWATASISYIGPTDLKSKTFVKEKTSYPWNNNDN